MADLNSSRILLGLLVVTAALAGCAEPPGDGGAPATPPASGTPPGATPPATAGAAGVCTSTKDPSKSSANPVWTLDTTMGTVRVTLFCDKTPITAQHFVNLTEKGCFDGTRFHRVITDFMNQGGDPLSKDDSQKARWGTGGPEDCGYAPDTIVDEFYCADGTVSYTHPATCPSGLGLKHATAGTLSMANTGRPHTGGSQFFLTAVPTDWLDGKHAVFGHTTDQESLDVAMRINAAGSSSGTPRTLVTLTKATIAWE